VVPPAEGTSLDEQLVWIVAITAMRSRKQQHLVNFGRPISPSSLTDLNNHAIVLVLLIVTLENTFYKNIVDWRVYTGENGIIISPLFQIYTSLRAFRS